MVTWPIEQCALWRGAIFIQYWLILAKLSAALSLAMSLFVWVGKSNEGIEWTRDVNYHTNKGEKERDR